MDFSGGSVVQNVCKVGDLLSITGWRRSPEKSMATHSSIIAWRILWTKEPAGYSPWSCKESGHNLATEQEQILLQNYILMHYI